jgi:hypothetical protein
VKEREVIEFGKRAVYVAKAQAEQSAYEKRSYLHPDSENGVDPNQLTHVTSHTVKMIQERLLADLQKLYSEQAEPKNPEFKTMDVITLYNTKGPARGDIVRTAFRALAKQGKIEIVPHEHGRRTTYTWKLLELVPPVQTTA